MTTQSLSIAEAAARLGVSQQTIRRRIKRGSLRAELVVGPHGEEYRLRPEELTTQQATQAYAEASHVTTPEPTQAYAPPTQVPTQQTTQEATQAAAAELERFLAELDAERTRADRLEAENARLVVELARLQTAIEERERQDADRRAEIEFLRAELERRGQSEVELRVLLLRATQALETAQRALPAPEPVEEPAPAPKRRWWWRR